MLPLASAQKQIRILTAMASLGSTNQSQCSNAMQSLYECGASAVWCLALAVTRSDQPRLQFNAAVVLHWLNDRRGIAFLTDTLRWRLPSDNKLFSDLRRAYLSINGPDAVQATLTVWNMLPDAGDHFVVRTFICDIWAHLRDASVLPALVSKAPLINELFERTIPCFGEAALPALAELSRSSYYQNRLLVVRTLAGSTTWQNAHKPLIDILTPLLRDNHLTVRNAVPYTLSAACGTHIAMHAVCEALRSGFGSPNALHLLRSARPADAHVIVQDYINNCADNGTSEGADDLRNEIINILVLLIIETVPIPNTAPALLCRLLADSRQPETRCTIILTLGKLAPIPFDRSRQVQEQLWKHVCAPNRREREAAASAIKNFGDRSAAILLGFIEQSLPQSGIFSHLQAVLRGDADAGVTANTAVQHLSNWIARIGAQYDSSQERVEPTPAVLSGCLEISDRYRQMLHHSRAMWLNHINAHECEELAAISVAMLSAAGRLGQDQIGDLWAETVAFLHLPSRPGLPQRTLQQVRKTAALTLIEWYGKDSLPLLLEALWSADTGVQFAAVDALARLGNKKAVNHLRMIRSGAQEPLASEIQRALLTFERADPQMRTLVRAAMPVAADGLQLLRPAHNTGQAHDGDSLLRAAGPDQCDSTTVQ